MALIRIDLPRILSTCALLLFAGCSTLAPSGSQADSDFARTGPYVGLYGMKAYENFSISDSSIDSGDSDFGFGGRVGFRFIPALAVEVIAESVRGFEVSQNTVKADLDLLNVGAMGKFFLASDRFQPYILGGFGLAMADVGKDFDYDTDGGFLRGGVGLDVYLLRTLAIFGEANYDHMMGGVSDLHHLNFLVGAMFRF